MCEMMDLLKYFPVKEKKKAEELSDWLQKRFDE